MAYSNDAGLDLELEVPVVFEGTTESGRARQLQKADDLSAAAAWKERARNRAFCRVDAGDQSEAERHFGKLQSEAGEPFFTKDQARSDR